MPGFEEAEVRKFRSTTTLAIAFSAAILATAANAQVRCLEGRTATGECVSPSLAVSARQAAIIFAQPSISFTTLPILPVDDWSFRYPDNLIPNELKPTLGSKLAAPVQ
jgi:hypothetical protein